MAIRTIPWDPAERPKAITGVARAKWFIQNLPARFSRL